MSGTPPAAVVNAQDIITALTDETSNEKLYRLSNSTIQGKLDLRHLTITKAVEINGCGIVVLQSKQKLNER